jgi:hypothetical protein
VSAAEIVILMAGTAFFGGDSETDWTAPHVHGVRVALVALPRIISHRVAIHAAGMA